MAEDHSNALGARPWSRAVLEDLWARHRGYVGAVLIAAGARSSEVEDLAQDVALAWVDRHAEIRDADAVRGWLRTVARNLVHQAARRRGTRREESVDAGGVGASPEAPRSDVPGAEGAGMLEAERVLLELAGLPEESREVLVLRGVHGMSQKAIAEVLGVGVRAVESRLARARRLLRRRSGSDGGHPDRAQRGVQGPAARHLDECNGVARTVTHGAGDGRDRGMEGRGENGSPRRGGLG